LAGADISRICKKKAGFWPEPEPNSGTALTKMHKRALSTRPYSILRVDVKRFVLHTFYTPYIFTKIHNLHI